MYGKRFSTFTIPTHFLPVIAHLSMIFYTIWRLTDQNQLSIKFTYFWSNASTFY